MDKMVILGLWYQLTLILQIDNKFNLIKYFDRNPNARSFSTFDGSPMNKTLGDWLPCVYVDKKIERGLIQVMEFP